MASASSRTVVLFSWLYLMLLVVYWSPTPTEGIRACGVHLVMLLNMICGNEIALLSIFQGSSNEVYFQGADNGPEYGPSQAGVSIFTERRWRVIMNECCKKSCTTNEALQLCRS